MDTNIERICTILDQIKNELLQFEQETVSIISCDIDNIEEHTENRVSITQKIDKCFNEIDDICSRIPNGTDIRKLIKNLSDYSNVQPENEEIFLKAQMIFSIINRIKDSDIQAVGRINYEKEILIKKIREINNGQSAKASKFKVGIDTSGSNKHFNNKKSI